MNTIQRLPTQCSCGRPKLEGSSRCENCGNMPDRMVQMHVKRTSQMQTPGYSRSGAAKKSERSSPLAYALPLSGIGIALMMAGPKSLVFSVPMAVLWYWQTKN